MDVVLVPGEMRFSAQIDRGVESALKAAGHTVRTLCRDCLSTIGPGALAEAKADLLLSIHGRRFPHALLAHAPGIKVKAVWLVDEPQEVDLSEGYGKHFDIVLTNDRNTIGVHGPHKCWYLPLAADPSVHRPRILSHREHRDGTAKDAKVAKEPEESELGNGEAGRREPPNVPLLSFRTPFAPSAFHAVVSMPSGSSVANKTCDVVFAGGILPERARLLDQAYALAPDLAWRIVGPDRWHKPVSFGPVWERCTVSHEEYVQAISSARIVLDIPRDELVSFAGRTNRRGIPATGVGCRPFEVTACGRFLLTDDSRADLPVLFPEGVGSYRRGDAASLVEQVRYWLENEEEREAAALAAREHCLQKHTYAVRVRELADIVGAWLDTRLPAPPARAAKAPRLAARVEGTR